MININIDENKSNNNVTIRSGSSEIIIRNLNNNIEIVNNKTDENDDPNKRFDMFKAYAFNTTKDVDNFCNRFNHANNYIDYDGMKLSLGNKIIIMDGKYNSTWLIAGFDCEHDQVASDGTFYDNGYGILLIPETTILKTIWSSNSNTENGYLNSNIHKKLENIGCDYKEIFKDHLVQRNVLLSNAIDGDHSNNHEWTKAYMTLMSVSQIGSHDSNKYDSGESNYKLPLFDFIPIQLSDDYFWLRDINNMGSAFVITCCGDKYPEMVYTTNGVRPLMMIR